MKKKKRRLISSFFMVLTVFMTVFTGTYSFLLIKDEKSHYAVADYSETIYRKESDNFLELPQKAADESKTEESNTQVTVEADITPNTHSTAENKAVPSAEYVNVLNASDGKIYHMPLEEYVACVVYAEMPLSAPLEALKAQAVASRTLAVRFISDNDKSAHGGADICTSSSHCQGYADLALLSGSTSESVRQGIQRVKSAVKETEGVILIYDGEPIVAAFHASSGEMTASSKEVWGGAVDYLVSVRTDEIYDHSLVSEVVSSKSFERQGFLRALEKAGVDGLSDLKDKPFPEWMSGVVRTESGRVDYVNIGSVSVEGDFLRRALGLKSCDFSFSFSNDTITFTCNGYGHGVGMSQLGAVSLAKSGESFASILLRYYPGCKAIAMKN